MSRLRETFAERRASGRKSLLPYITGGYPDVETTAAILRTIDPGPCACVEVGIPFSDPIADGPVIQTSFSRALAEGFKLDDLLAILRQQREDIAVPLLAMVSYSIVYRRGPEAFVDVLREAGFDGVIVPDLALEEAADLVRLTRERDSALVMMVAPTTEPDRQRQIADLSEPFIYYQSLAGVTGERASLPPDLQQHVQELRVATGKPICVGFGVSTAAQIQRVCTIADGAIVGSAIVRRMTAAVEEGCSPGEIAARVDEFIQSLTTNLT
jgi:tryptophan synthase alpha chain